MIERVAKAMFESDQKEHGFGRGQWTMDGRPMTWEEIISDPRLANDVQRYRTNAKAALQAIRDYLSIREINGTAILEELATIDAIDEALAD